MKTTTTFHKLYKNSILGKLFVLLFWLIIWQILYLIVGKAYILPSPFQTLTALSQMIQEKDFYLDVAATMMRVVKGVLLSLAVGGITAVLAFFSPFVRAMLSPVVTVLKTTPVMAVIIFAILWLQSGNVPVFACFMMSYPVVYTNVLSGLDSTNKQYLEMADLYQVRQRDQIRYIYLPFIRPHIKSAVALSTGLSWKTIVAAEVLASPKLSMGYNLMVSKMYFETDQLFAWMIAIIIFSILFEKVISVLTNKLLTIGFAKGA